MKKFVQNLRSVKLEVPKTVDAVFSLSVIAFVIAVTVYLLAKITSAILIYLIWAFFAVLVLSGLYLLFKKIFHW